MRRGTTAGAAQPYGMRQAEESLNSVLQAGKFTPFRGVVTGRELAGQYSAKMLLISGLCPIGGTMGLFAKIPRRLGFRMDETMRGTHRLVKDYQPEGGALIPAGSEMPFEFSCSWGHPNLVDYFNPLGNDFCSALLTGTVTIGGVCDRAPMRGSLEFRYLTESLIRYAFEFEVAERRYSFVGEKRDIRPWNLHRTHTTCFGTVTDIEDGTKLCDAVVHFDLKELPTFVSSLRLES